MFSDFRRVPSDTTFAQGVKMLKAEELKLATNPRGSHEGGRQTKLERPGCADFRLSEGVSPSERRAEAPFSSSKH